jgi:hypothetical protein
MTTQTEPAASASRQTNTSFDIDDWRKQQADRAERFHARLAGVIAKKEAALDLPDFASVAGRRTIKVSFAPKITSWHYRTYEMHWATFVALVSVANKKDRKDWCDALMLADLQPDDRAGKGYARPEAGNVNGMDVVGLDYDKGHLTREQLEARVRETALEAVVSESYSYATTQMSVTVATVNAKGDVQLSALGKRAAALDINDWHTISGALVKTHLVEDEGYCAEALGDVRVVEVVEDVDEEDVITIQLRLEHAPLPKLRVFVLLDGQFYRGNGENNARFSVRYLRDVWEPLTKVAPPHSDKACKDISRRWYVRGHRPGHKPVPPTHISGKPFTVITTAASSAEPERAKAPRGETGGQQRQNWMGFQAADATVALIAGAVDKRGDATMPLVSVDCPFREFHNTTKTGKNQLFLFNAEHPGQVPVVKCHSGSCQGHEHTWEEYLSALFAGHNVSAPEYWLRDASTCGTEQNGEDEGEETFSGFVETGEQPEFQNYKSYPYPFSTLCDHVFARLVEQNAAAPRIFVMDGALVRIQRNTLTGQTYAEKLNTNGLRHEIDRAMHFCNVFFEGNTHKKQGYPCPKDIVEHIMASPSFSGMPELISITDTPFFDKDCNLIETSGYHAPSKTFYQPPGGFRMPPVPREPTERDVARARRILAEPLYNIPFDDGDTAVDGQASRANWTAKLIQAFVHEPISGACPLYAVMKPKERTGATLTAQIHSIIAYGTRAQLQNEKKDEEELQKTIVSLLKAGARSIVLDNLHKKLDSATVATVATGTIYQGRQLCTNDMIIAPIRCEFEFNGNNLRTTNEMRERSVLIRIDAKSPNPGDRDTKAFRYPLLLDSVEKARPLYVWAVLTLIQAWVAAGRPKWSGKAMGGFEKHNGIVGGILDNAGYVDKEGKSLFLSNRSLLRESVGDDSAVPTAFVQLWWNAFQGVDCRIGMLAKDAEPADYADDASEYRHKKIETLVDLYTANAGNLDLGFNGWQKAAWQKGLRGHLDKMLEQHFVILDGKASVQVCVKFRSKTRAWYLVRSGAG